MPCDSDDDELAALNPIRYRGYYYDVETGLYYVSSRYYDPVTCRWINADGVIAGTSDSVQGYNQFAYCFNNPINMEDETGHWPKWMKEIGSRFVHTVKIISKIVASPFKAITAKVGGGIGFGAKATVNINSVPVEIGVVNSITDSLTYEYGKFDVRNTTSTTLGVSFAGKADFSSSSGYEHSYFDKNCDCSFWNSSFGEKNTCTANKDISSKDMTIGFSLGAYFLLGGEFSFGIDLKVWNDELISIFEESLAYGK